MPEIQKISIAIASEQLLSIKAAVDVGEYATTSEVVRGPCASGSGSASCAAKD